MKELYTKQGSTPIPGFMGGICGGPIPTDPPIPGWRQFLG